MFSLQYLDQFKQLLTNYKMSEEAMRLVNEVPYVGLTGMTAAGRNTLIKELLKTGKFYFMISDTTRPPRYNNGILEQNGVEYWFRSEEEVLAELKAGKFIEAAVIHNQQVSGQNVSQLEIAKSKGLIAINEIDIQGVDIIRKVSDNLFPIFVLPPSYQEWMRRWSSRGNITAQERSNRLASAKKELQAALDRDYYHFLVNDDLQKTVVGLQKMISGKIDPDHESSGRKLALEILEQLSKENKE
jgi:guanylate kinase